MPVTLTLNGKSATLDADPQMPLLWAIRELAGITGTKFGCGIAACGACTVHLNGVAVRSCVVPVFAAAGARLTTIEGLGASAGQPEGEHPVQKAWIAVQGATLRRRSFGGFGTSKRSTETTSTLLAVSRPFSM